MRSLLSLALISLCCSFSAQETVTYPFNPDANGDTFVGVSDVLEGISTYDNFFFPTEIMIGDTSLSNWIQLLNQTLINQQSAIDSLQANLTNVIGGINTLYNSIEVDYIPSDTLLMVGAHNRIIIQTPLEPLWKVEVEAENPNCNCWQTYTLEVNEGDLAQTMSVYDLINFITPIWGEMHLDLSELNSDFVEIQFDRIFDAMDWWLQLAIELEGVSIDEYWQLQVSLPQINIIDGERDLGDVRPSDNSWYYTAPGQPGDGGVYGVGLHTFKRLSSNEWVRTD